MLRTKLVPALVALVVCALVVPALSLAGRNTIEESAQLKGKNEVPGPGSPKGKGEIHVFLKPTKNKVCFELEVSKLDTITASHIHKGAPDQAGTVKVTLIDSQIEGTGNYEGCVKDVRSKLLDKIAAKPEAFYVNVHTLDYPEGAIRGQLEPSAG
jgi:hypothetical protein